MNTAHYVSIGEKVINKFRHLGEPNPHLELSDEEYFLVYCTEKQTPDEIEQQIVTEERHGK